MARSVSPPRRNATVDDTDVARPAYDEARADRDRVRDRIRWGPVVAGVLTTIATATILTILGLAIGLTAFDPGAEGVGTAAAIWGIITVIAAFFAGGFIAGRTAGEPTGEGTALNGLMVGITTLAVMLWLVGTGVGNALGAVGVTVGDIAAVGPQLAPDQATGVFGDAEGNAWATLVALLVALGAATAGGVVGNHRSDTPERERPRR